MFAKDLAKLIRTLAVLDPAEAPVVSCYMDLTGRPRIDEQRAGVLGHAVGAAWREPFEEAMDRIRAYVVRCLSPHAKGLAIFARGGSNPMFLPIQSPLPLPDRLVVNSTPDMFDLLKFEDHARNYLAVRVCGNAASVLEVRLGAITGPIWNRHEAFRGRFVRQRGRVSYGRGGPEDDVVEELAALLNALVESQTPEAVILDGAGKTARRVLGALRAGLAPGLRSRPPSVREVQAGLRTAAAEFEPAPDWVETLRRQLLIDSLAAAGTQATMDALMERQLEVVFMTPSYRPDPGWVCRACWNIAVAPEKPFACSDCGRAELIRFDIREDMLRAAETLGCGVEQAEDGGLVGRLGGVGALLRHSEPGVRCLEAV
ncbi:MAG: hypothetical protein ACM3S5_14340 [Rhodospirillales bacterium]